MRPVRMAARAMLGAIFVASGARAVANPEQYAERAKPVTDRIAPLLERADPRLPTEARTLVRVNGAVQLAGGLLLATGRFTRPAAAVLAGSLVPTTIAGHPFWTYENPTERRNQQVHFLKNLGLLGGLLLAAADTQGQPSLRWRANRAVADARRSAQRTVTDARRSAKRAVRSTQRTVRTARRDARIAVRAADVGRRLPS